MFDVVALVFGFITTYYIPALIIYLVVGMVYAVLKWTFKLLKLRRLVNEITDEDIQQYKSRYDNNVEDTLAGLRARAAAKVFDKHQYPPLVKQNKGWFMFWALAWPINLPWTMFHDIAKEFFAWVWHKSGGALQRIADSILPK